MQDEKWKSARQQSFFMGSQRASMEHDPEESHQVSQNVTRFGIELASSGRSKCYECKKSLLIFFLFFLIKMVFCDDF